MGWTAGVRFPTGTRDFSLLHSIHIVFGTLLTRVKQLEREANLTSI
jgi:hypothetical protein